MPLTPEDVRNKQFTAVRLREGYDVNEVDDFLDEVVTELERLTADNEDLRAKLDACEQRLSSAPAKAQPAPAPAPPPPPPAPAPQPAPAPAPAPAPVAAAAPSNSSGADGAARLLQLAQKTADELVSDARSQAEKILGEARNKGNQIVGEARGRAERLDRESQERQRQTIGVLETRKVELEREVDTLRAFEREYRTRLKSYLEGQLRQLEGQNDGDRSNAERSMSSFGSSADSPFRSAEHR